MNKIKYKTGQKKSFIENINQLQCKSLSPPIIRSTRANNKDQNVTDFFNKKRSNGQFQEKLKTIDLNAPNEFNFEFN